MARDRSYPPLPEPLPVPVVDNHTHIEPGQGPEGGLDLDEHIARARAVGVEGIVQCGCDLDAARWTAHAVQIEPALLGAIAIHPNDAARMADGPASSMGLAYDEALGEIAQMAATTNRIRAIGETGLDYYRTGPGGRPAQEKAFGDHIALALELDLTLQIHDRDAHADILRVLAACPPPRRTVFHCFSGDREMAEVIAANGWYISVAGTATFSNAHELREAIAATELSRLLVETDAPYLTPHPHRGRPNAPYMAATTARAIAAIHSRPLEVVCQALNDNAVEVYGDW